MLSAMRPLLSLALLAAACSHGVTPGAGRADAPGELALPQERHLRNVRQLTFGGENAEAYFSFDGERLIFQSTRDGRGCDQEYVMGIDGSPPRMVSTGQGRVTCGYFFPDASRILYSSTHALGAECPPRPDFSQGYVWALYDYQIYTARPDGSDVRPLAPAPGYNAEATISNDGWIVFTSTRDGDLDLYKVRLDGSGLVRLTSTLGYDGGAFFSPDGRRIVYRASRPKDAAEGAQYRALLAEKLVRPTELEIWVMNADGTGARQVTHLAAASFAPFFHPDGRRIIFASNHADPKRRNFDLYLVNDDGTRDVRRVPHVLARRQEARLRVEPQRLAARRDERVHRRLGGMIPGGKPRPARCARPHQHHELAARDAAGEVLEDGAELGREHHGLHLAASARPAQRRPPSGRPAPGRVAPQQHRASAQGDRRLDAQPRSPLRSLARQRALSRDTEKGARSTGGGRPRTAAATASAVMGVSKMPFRVCPVA